MLNKCTAGLFSFLFPMLISCELDPQSPQFVQQAPSVTSQVSGSFPRFPHNTQAKTLRDVMVFYSPDDIFSNITWKSIGYPDSGFFMIHNAFPKLKFTMQIVAENRYLGEIPNRNIEYDPVAAQIWRDLFTKPEFRSWLEFGNHGYFHSPEGDPNLDHHEFNGNQNAAAHDSGFCYGTFRKARKTYAAIGLDNDRISVMRFPGYAHTPMALQASADLDFLAYFEYIASGRERFLDLGAARKILAIPTVHLADIFDTGDLVRSISSREIDSSNLRASDTYQTATAKGMAILEGLVQDGGVINIFDHWWEHSQPGINGIYYRFEFFKDVLAGLDRKYGDRLWWGFGSELAIWSHIKRNAPVSIAMDEGGMTLAFGQPDQWKAGWSITAGYTVILRGTPRFPDPKSIHYTLASEDYTKKHFLGEGEYWADGNRLHFNFPYSGMLKIRVSFDESHPD